MKSRLVLALAAAAIAAAVLVPVAGSAPRHDKMLYGCAYVTNLGSSSDVNVLIWDKSAPGAKGWVMFKGSGVNRTDKFTLDNRGWHTDRINVTTFDDEHITVGLYTLKLEYSFTYALNATTDVTTKSCKPQ